MGYEKRDERHEVRWVSADDSGGLVDGRCLLPHETGKAQPFFLKDNTRRMNALEGQRHLALTVSWKRRKKMRTSRKG